MGKPLVSVIIPALNEAGDIAGCIEAIGAQDYPASAIEVVLIDGASTDGTVESATRSRALRLRPVCCLAKPKGAHGLRSERRSASRAGRVRRADRRRSRVQTDYVSLCVGLLADRCDVGEVGGAQIATPRSAHALEVGLARAQRNRLTSGFSRYRRSVVSGPAEHVWMGAFRADELRRLGGWDDATALNEDFELSQRYIASGQVVWFDARLRSGYLARPSLRGAGPSALLLRPCEGDVVGTGPASAAEANGVARPSADSRCRRGGVGPRDRLARDSGGRGGRRGRCRSRRMHRPGRGSDRSRCLAGQRRDVQPQLVDGRDRRVPRRKDRRGPPPLLRFTTRPAPRRGAAAGACARGADRGRPASSARDARPPTTRGPNRDGSLWRA